jgi:hypothetical protein
MALTIKSSPHWHLTRTPKTAAGRMNFGSSKMSKVYLGIVIILAGTVFGFGQKDKAAPSVERNAPNQPVLSAGTVLNAELQSTLDVKNTQIGDRVVLKTTRAIKQNGDVLVAKGTTLIGRVTEVQRRTKQNGTSRLGMIFDRIEGKNLSAPIATSIVSITNAAAAVSTNDGFDSDLSSSSQSSTSVSRSGGSSGGLLGGVGNTVGGLVNTTTQTAGTVTGAVSNTASGTTGVVGQTLNGIQISTAASGSAGSSTTLSSANRDIRIDKGAAFNLRVDSPRPVQE